MMHASIRPHFPFFCLTGRVLCAALLGYTSPLYSQISSADLSSADGSYIAHNGGFSLTVEDSSASLAFFIDTTDITAFLSQDGTQWVYPPQAPPLPPGQHELIIYQTDDPAQWQEINRLPLNVLTPSGFEVSVISPTLDITLKTQLASDTNGDATALERDTFQDGELQAVFASEQQTGTMTLRSNINIVGFSYRPDALRFAEMNEDAPKIDLADYLVEYEHGAASVALGHISYGQHPLLIDSVSNRGLQARYQISDELDFSLGLMNGNSIVGYNNIFGLSHYDDNRVAAATIGVELLPTRPGGLRAEFTYMNSERPSEDDFNTGEISDAEKNSGFGFRLLGSSESGRLRGELNYAHSRYTNPNDPNLELDDPDTPIVEVKPSSDDAYSAEISYDILAGESMLWDTPVTLTSSLRYAYADALYNSLGAFVDANLALYTLGLDGQFGPVGTQFAYTHAQDNVDDLDTLLTTRTRSLTFALNLPLQSLFGAAEEPQWWWPELAYTLDRVHQEAVNTPDPELSGFDDPSQLPDQITRLDSLDFTWYGEQWDASYRFSIADEDNRQTGREQADFTTLEHAVNIGLRPINDLNLTLGTAYLRNHDREQSLVNYSNTYTFGLDWTFWNDWVFNGSVTYIDEDDNASLAARDTTTLQAQISYRFELPGPASRKLPGQWFLRYDREKLNELDTEFELDSSATTWTISSGLSFSFY
ncbi:MAG: hypothetical protein R3F53_08535 [Gammaproteobacteria bacterium]